MFHAAQIALRAEVWLGLAVRAEGVGVGEQSRQLGVPAGIIDRALQGRDSTTARAAFYGPDDERRVLELTRAVRRDRFMEQQHAEVGGDRVKAAAVHDPRAAFPRERVEAVDRLAHEQHLAGEVGVVGARPRARLDDRQPVTAVGADGGGNGTRRTPPTRRRERRSVVSATISGQSAARAPSEACSVARRVDERPASPMRTCGGAARERYSAHRRPTKLVAPNRTTSSSRSVPTAGYYARSTISPLARRVSIGVLSEIRFRIRAQLPTC